MVDVLVIGARIDPADIPALCERVRALLQTDGDALVCDVGAVAAPDAATLDALARLQLTLTRLGRRMRLRHACPELQGFLALTGLADVLPLCDDLRVEPGRQTEEREEVLGVEEETDPADPAV